jgi:ubiquinone/menaquinone biosynthesis C-methylase UbiE
MSDSKTSYRGRVKYDEQTARKYQVRKEGKHQAEMRMVDRAFALVPKNHRLLDVPCGGGRVTIHLAKKGYALSSADLSDSMIQITRESVAKHKFDIKVEKQDIEKLTYADRAFDTVISFRLFHHFPAPDIRLRAVTELCRVARKYVALSYFSPASVTSVKRSIRAALGGKKSEKHTTSLTEVEGYFEKRGFRLVKDFPQLRLIHTMHLALFERVGESKP